LTVAVTGDHVFTAPPHIVDAGDLVEIVEWLGQAVDAVFA
jgi:adenosylmethionine-8-amino-7-oxononanoate aminotransferase